MRHIGEIAMRALRRPVLHFVLAGGLLFLCASWLQRIGDREFRRAGTVTVGKDDIVMTTRTRARQAVDAEILYREAVARGLGQSSEAVRIRLVRLARFLDLAAPEDTESLLNEARALGLDAEDPIIRRHLVQTMRLAVAQTGSMDLPDEEELQRFFARRAPRFRLPRRTRLTHVYLSRGRRGDAAEVEATTLLKDLRAGDVEPEAAASRGDPFAAGSRAFASDVRLDLMFGSGFAAVIDKAPVQEWIGPVRSAHGSHLVWIHERRPAATPPLESVRSRLVHAYLTAQGEEHLRRWLRETRRHYRVVVAE